jgi:hypothetical protein
VPPAQRPFYLRWVRFYLDFCQKYEHPPREELTINPFLAKLATKGQSQREREQAGKAVHLLLQRGMKKDGGLVVGEAPPPDEPTRGDGLMCRWCFRAGRWMRCWPR